MATAGQYIIRLPSPSRIRGGLSRAVALVMRSAAANARISPSVPSGRQEKRLRKQRLLTDRGVAGKIGRKRQNQRNCLCTSIFLSAQILAERLNVGNVKNVTCVRFMTSRALPTMAIKRNN